MKFDNSKAVTCVVAGLALIPLSASARLLPASRKVLPADAEANCKGLSGRAKGWCVAYNSGVESEKAKDKIAAKYLEEFGHMVPGSMMLPPFPNRSVLDEALLAYIVGAGEWDGFINEVYYGNDISHWNVSQVTDFSRLLYQQRTFNEDLGSWDVSGGIDFSGMFLFASDFNQDIGAWDVSGGEDFNIMFQVASNFNQDIGAWDVSSGVVFMGMFMGAYNFNQDLSTWNGSMFAEARRFNQDLRSWDVSSGIDFDGMFSRAGSFNQDLGTWNVTGDYVEYMFCESQMPSPGDSNSSYYPEGCDVSNTNCRNHNFCWW